MGTIERYRHRRELRLEKMRTDGRDASDSLVYGLCKGAGIELPEPCTPTEAWEIYHEATGVSTSDAMEIFRAQGGRKGGDTWLAKASRDAVRSGKKVDIETAKAKAVGKAKELKDKKSASEKAKRDAKKARETERKEREERERTAREARREEERKLAEERAKKVAEEVAKRNEEAERKSAERIKSEEKTGTKSEGSKTTSDKIHDEIKDIADRVARGEISVDKGHKEAEELIERLPEGTKITTPEYKDAKFMKEGGDIKGRYSDKPTENFSGKSGGLAHLIATGKAESVDAPKDSEFKDKETWRAEKEERERKEREEREKREAERKAREEEARRKAEEERIAREKAEIEERAREGAKLVEKDPNLKDMEDMLNRLDSTPMSEAEREALRLQIEREMEANRESLRQINNELHPHETATPVTMTPKFEERRDEFMREYRTQSFMRDNGITEEMLERANENLKSLIDGNELSMDSPSEVVNDIVAERFKNGIETKTGHGSHDWHSRREMSEYGFGTAPKARSASMEKYGHLNSQERIENRKLSGYGGYRGVTFTFDKGRLDGRVSYTSLDSLGPVHGRSMVPGLDGSHPTYHGLISTGWGRDDSANGIKALARGEIKSVDDFYRRFGTGYLELQYHGTITYHDTTAVYFHSKEAYNQLSAASYRKLLEAGIRIIRNY